VKDLKTVSKLKPIPAALLALGLSAATLPAMAQTLTPAGSATAVSSSPADGIAIYNGGITIQCKMTFNLSVPSASTGTFSVTSVSFTNGGGTEGSLCGVYSFSIPYDGLPWAGSVISATQAEISGMTVAILGMPSCTGNITGTYSNGTSTTPAALSLTGDKLGTSCTITSGVLSITSNSTSPGGLIYTE